MSKVKGFFKKHGPELCTVAGVISAGATVVLAVKATPKALELIEEERDRQNYELVKVARDNGDDQCEQIDRISPVDTVKVAWKCYIPAAATGVLSILFFVGANSISARRHAALMAAYTISTTDFEEYRKKIVEKVGKEMDQEANDAVAEARAINDPADNKEVFITARGDSLCYDPMSGRYFRSDAIAIEKAVNEINRRLVDINAVSLNEFYAEIGLKPTELGNELGWHIDGGTVEIRTKAITAEDVFPCLALVFDKKPKYDYWKWF